jgi:hypothetical protein
MRVKTTALRFCRRASAGLPKAAAGEFAAEAGAAKFAGEGGQSRENSQKKFLLRGILEICTPLFSHFALFYLQCSY